jgi:short-subunit dehydrogenase
MARVLILGAKSDIANAVAKRFAREGFDLYLAARDSGELEPVCKDLDVRYGIRAEALEFDVLDYEGHEAFYEDISEAPIGAICVVGYLGDQEVAQRDFKEAEMILDTNYKGCVSILNVIASYLEARREGFIIAVSSVAGDRGRQSNYLYGSAKSGLSTYLSGLRNRLQKSGVHVMTVKPGFVNTTMTEGMGLPPLLTAEPAEVAEDIYKAFQKKRDVLYTKWFWRYIMLIIRNIPERIFKRMKM